MRTPVLLIHFNRPDHTRRQVELLRKIAPFRVWILCDGPRAWVPGEIERVAEVRELLDELPWRCEVQRLYRTRNFGCFSNISEGVDWFFKDCEAGIILEDDILPDPSFFPYAEEMLTRYADSPAVFAVSGHNRRREPLDIASDYGFSNYFECWGWASWSRAWKQYDRNMQGWKDKKLWQSICFRVLPGMRARWYWNRIFTRVANRRVDSWAYRFILSIWNKHGCVIIPKNNLTENIGFGPAATATAHMEGTAVPASNVDLPLQHPKHITVDPVIDKWFEDGVHSKSLSVRVDWCVRTVRRSFSRRARKRASQIKTQATQMEV